MSFCRRSSLVLALLASCAAPPPPRNLPPEARRPSTDADLRFWLETMIVHHRYSPEEVWQAAGLTPAEQEEGLRRFGIGAMPPPRAGSIRVLPYPGGRHPRIGFLDGALDPQRETKVSVFTPWDPASYVVVDVPEAIFSNLGLTYLAHRHVPTLWTKQGIELPRLEWERRENGTLRHERKLPNGISFETVVTPTESGVRFDLSLRNGTASALTGLRVQNCVMLARAAGFEAQTKENKRLSDPFALARDSAGTRWVITRWTPLHRTWQNPPCPCIHSDPKFPDCAPGETVRVEGWLWFYEGPDIDGELARLAARR